jgi:hypothetical protein
MKGKCTSALLSFALALTALLTSVISSAQESPAALTQPIIRQAKNFDISPRLSELAKTETDLPFGFHVAEPLLRPKAHKAGDHAEHGRTVQDAAAQTTVTNPLLPTIGINVLGVGMGFQGYHVPDAPADANLAAGDTQVVQFVNVQYAVFDKNTGNALTGPLNGSSIWQGFPGLCATGLFADITAQWDKIAHRWLMSMVSYPSGDICLAVSTTPDALGTFYRYEFVNVPGYGDWPKFGVWPDGYYQSNNEYDKTLLNYIGAYPCAYERAKMLKGDPAAQQVCFLDTANGTLFDDSMVPSDIDSPNLLPPGGMPNIFVGSIDNGPGGMDSNVYYYKFHVDWNTPSNSTFTGVNGSLKIPVTPYTNAPVMVAEPGDGNLIDTLGDRLMYRFAYRTYKAGPGQNSHIIANTYQQWLISHAVASGSTIGVRWYEFRANSGSADPKLFQQGTYQPDTTARIMSSLAADNKGNIAMAYTTTSGSLFPGIAYTGRTPNEAPGTMEAEATIIAGTGSQVDSRNRWGDYTDMAIDNDGCTFWYTNQYYQTTASFAWSTQIASLRFPNCQ